MRLTSKGRQLCANFRAFEGRRRKKFKASGDVKKNFSSSIPIFIVARYDRCNRHAISSAGLIPVERW